jgi:glutaminyl-tRNA synthetase
MKINFLQSPRKIEHFSRIPNKPTKTMTTITRFPPEPNGYLHIGHCKSLLINYEEGNVCHLRLDDTNPLNENESFVHEIIEDMKWMGYDPGRITYTSDYFEKLYDFATLLIRHGHAYVDFSSPEKLKSERSEGIENKYRNLPPEIHVIEFENMKHRKYAPGEAVLRLKIDMSNDNFTLRDPIAYRIIHATHFKTGDNWCIYPSYDYSHGIVDALENITTSYCTDEFYIRRDLYYWTIHTLHELGCDLSPAHVHEFGKLTVENNTLSKRNIKKLIDEGAVSGYDDPSLLTVRGMRNRGYTPEIIKAIAKCSGLGKVKTIVSMKLVYHLLIHHYNPIAIRCFAVVDPIRCRIMNLEEEKICKHPHLPNRPECYHTTSIHKDIYIEREDFKLEHDDDYYRLSPKNKMVRLKFFDIVRYENYEEDRVYVSACDLKKDKSVKSTMHWLSVTDAVPAKFVLVDIENPLSKEVRDGFVEKYVIECNEDTVFEFERIGYFKLLRKDENNIPHYLRIVHLKE